MLLLNIYFQLITWFLNLYFPLGLSYCSCSIICDFSSYNTVCVHVHMPVYILGCMSFFFFNLLAAKHLHKYQSLVFSVGDWV